MGLSCARPGDFDGNPYETVGANTLFWKPGHTQLVCTWSISAALKDKTYKWLFYVDGVVIDRNATSPKVLTVVQNYIPKITAVAIPPAVDYDNAYDPLCGGQEANILTFWDSGLINNPCNAILSPLDCKIKVYFRRSAYYYYHLIINDVLVDTDSHSGDEYNFGTGVCSAFPTIILVPLPAKSSDMLSWGVEFWNLYENRICPDVLLPEYGYVAQEFPLQEQVLDKVKKNYISVSDKQRGLTVPQSGENITVAPRQALVNGVVVTKPATKKMCKGAQDYRYATQFDKTKFYSIYDITKFTDHIPCETKDLAKGTATQINTLDETIPTDLVE
jgi:hypothetical protein